jgi:geranylgeranyl diphosphate synthase, type II
MTPTASSKAQAAKSAFSEAVIKILEPYKTRFEPVMKSSIELLGPKNKLRDACEYALIAPGKRFRPALVYMVAEAIGKGTDVSEAALAVEYFHTASLIADDLPCMDNDDYRRGRPTVHKVWNESIALLASFALISSGFEHIARNADFLKKRDDDLSKSCAEIAQIGVLEASYTMGSIGLIGGQYLDLFMRDLNEKSFLDIIEKKTAALFELCFVLGWIFGGGERSKLKTVHEAARQFGIAFQIIDDIDDMQKDREYNNPVNYANFFGLDKAIKKVHEACDLFQKCLMELQLSSTALNALSSGMANLSSQLG